MQLHKRQRTGFCGCVNTTRLNMWNVSSDDEEEQDENVPNCEDEEDN